MVAQVVEILPHGRQGPTYLTVYDMATDGMVMQGARASAAMVHLLALFPRTFEAWTNVSFQKQNSLSCFVKFNASSALHCH